MSELLTRKALITEISRILSPAIDPKAPYAKVIIGRLADLVTKQRERSPETSVDERDLSHG